MAHATETSVKWFYGQMQGAPWPTSWTGTTGGATVAVDILKACLVTGFNTLTFDSVVVTGGVAKATRASGHGFVLDQIVRVAGATPSGLNGDKRVLAITGQTIEFDATGIADGAASGTITIKTAPAGWDLAFEATNKAVFRSPNVNSPRSFYLYDESAGDRVSRVLAAYRNMTDILSGTDQWGSTTALTPFQGSAGSVYVPASWGTGRWMVIADDRTAWMVFVGQASGTASQCLTMLGFGDFQSFISGDSGNEFVMGAHPLNTGISSAPQGGGLLGAWQTSAASARAFLQKNGLGVLLLNNCGAFGLHGINGASGHSGPTFPSPVDNGMLLSDSLFRETTDNSLRGKNRGIYWCMQDRPLTETCPGMTVTGVSGLEGRTLMLLPFTPFNASSQLVPATNGRFAIDLTGPWG